MLTPGMIEIIDMVLLAYIAVLETITVQKILFPKKRAYNRKQPKLKVIHGTKSN